MHQKRVQYAYYKKDYAKYPADYDSNIWFFIHLFCLTYPLGRGCYFLISLIPAPKRKDKAVIKAIAIIIKGVIIKNDPPDLIPKTEKITAYPITKIISSTAKKTIIIPNFFDFCINRIYLIFSKGNFTQAAWRYICPKLVEGLQPKWTSNLGEAR